MSDSIFSDNFSTNTRSEYSFSNEITPPFLGSGNVTYDADGEWLFINAPNNFKQLISRSDISFPQQGHVRITVEVLRDYHRTNSIAIRLTESDGTFLNWTAGSSRFNDEGRYLDAVVVEQEGETNVLERGPGAVGPDPGTTRTIDAYWTESSMSLYIDGEERLSVDADTTVVDPTQLVLQFYQGDFRLKSITVDRKRPEVPNIVAIADVKPVQAVFETGLSEDPVMDLVNGKETAVLVYPGGDPTGLESDIKIKLSSEGVAGNLFPSHRTLSASEYQRLVNEDDYVSFTGHVRGPTGGDIAAKGDVVVEFVRTDSGESAATVRVPVKVWDTGEEQLLYYRQTALSGNYEKHIDKSNEFIRATYPVSEGTFSGTDEGTFDGSGIPGKVGAIEDLRELNLRAWWDSDGAKGVGVVSETYKNNHSIGAGFTMPKTPVNSILVQITYWTALAHELGHQFGLHTNIEEYCYTNSHKGGREQSDGYWVARGESGEYIRGRDAFMEKTASKNTLGLEWIDNSHDYDWQNDPSIIINDPGCPNAPIIEPGQGDFRDFDEILGKLIEQKHDINPLEEAVSISETDTSYQVLADSISTFDSTASATSTNRILFLQGAVRKDGSIDPAQWHFFEDELSTPEEDGAYSVVGRDADGNRVVERSFPVSYTALTPDIGRIETDASPFALAMRLPTDVQTIEFQTEGRTVDSYKVTAKLLHDAVASIPENGFADDVDADERRATLQEIVDAIRRQLENGDDRGAARTLRQEFRPALDRSLAHDYQADEPIEVTRDRLESLVNDAVERTTAGVPGVDEYGAVYDPDTLGEQGAVVATVTNQEDTGSDAKAGVMIRNDIGGSGDSLGYVICAVTPEDGFLMQWDDNDNGYLDTVRRAGETTYPCWLRLQKDGTEFIGSYSTDGNSWTDIASITFQPANDTQDAGIFATSGDPDAMSRVEFEDFTIENG